MAMAGDAEHHIEGGSPAPSGAQVHSSRRASLQEAHARDSLKGEDFERLEASLRHIEERVDSQSRLQEQRDISQDEMYEMQFDSMRRDLQVCIKSSDFENQRALLHAKIQAMELEFKDAIHSISNSLREEISKDARKLQDQLEKVSAAVLQQVKMVDERLKENAEADVRFEKLVGEKLARVENELGFAPADETGTTLPESPNGGGDGEGSAGGHAQRRAALASQQAIQDIESRIDSLEVKLERTQRELDEQLRQDVEDGRPSGRGSKNKLEHRVATLEDKVDEVATKETLLEEKIEEVAVKEAATTKEVQQLKEQVRSENPLDWLEERVGELVRKRGGERVDVITRLAEVTKQLQALEEWREEFLAEQKQFHAEQRQATATFVTQDAEPAAICDDEAGSRSFSKGGRPPTRGAARSGQIAVEGSRPSHVNLFEDMERLRCIIECMEQTMPLEVRRSIQFFKGVRKGADASSKGGTSAGSGGSAKQRSSLGRESEAPKPGTFELETEVLGLRSELDEQAQRVQRCEELLAREQANALRAVRGVERAQGQMQSKVDDLWHKLPQLTAILEPLQVHLTDGAAGPEARAETTLEALKPLSGLLEAALQKSIDQLRQDLLSHLTEVSGKVDLRAGADEFSRLRDRVECWARNPTPSPSQPSLSSYKSTALDRSRPDSSQELARATARWPPRSSERSKAAGSACHEKCKTPTCPRPVSAGSLPNLNKTK